MSLFYKIILNLSEISKCLKYRHYAIYTKTLNLPSTKFPTFVKKAKRPEHDKNLREVRMNSIFRSLSIEFSNNY